jgi:predicted ATPase
MQTRGGNDGGKPGTTPVSRAGAIPVRPTAVLPMRGRSEHTSRIDEVVAGLRSGRGAVLLVEGPPGIGKSRLVDDIAVRARKIGARALSSKAYEDQQTVPFAPLLEALCQADPPICDPAALSNLTQTVDLRYWVLRDLQTAIASAAAETPLSISIDDIHWADAGTVIALRALVAGLAESPVLWTFSMRSAGGRAEVRDAIATLTAARADSGHRLVLGALADEAVSEIAADLLSANVDESVLRLANTAHGNPFLVLELLRGLDEENRIRVGKGRASRSHPFSRRAFRPIFWRGRWDRVLWASSAESMKPFVLIC